MKRWLSSLRIATKLLIPSLTAVSFLAIFALACYLGFYRQKSALDDIFNTRFLFYQSSSDIIVSLKDVQTNLYRMASYLRNDTKNQSDDLAGEESAILGKATQETERMLKSSQLTKAEKEYLRPIPEQLSECLTLVTRFKGLEGGATSDTTTSTLIGTSDSLFTSIDKNLNELITLQKKLGRDQYSASARMFGTVLLNLGPRLSRRHNSAVRNKHVHEDQHTCTHKKDGRRDGERRRGDLHAAYRSCLVGRDRRNGQTFQFPHRTASRGNCVGCRERQRCVFRSE